MTSKDDSSKEPRGRVLVTFSRSWQALATIRSLGKHGLDVITGDELALTPGALSKYSIDSFRYPNPETDPEGFLAALSEAVDRFAPAPGVPYVLIPVHRETYLIARHRDRFESRISLALPESELIESVRDKGRLVTLATELGVRTPKTWAPHKTSEIDRLEAEVTYPAFVKVRSGVAGVGIERVEGPGELRTAFETLAAQLDREEALPIIQAAAPGTDYCVSALLDRGKLVTMMTYRNLRSIVEGAPGAIRQSVEAAVPEEATARLLEGLGWHGIAEVDFMWTGEPEDPAYLIEINPRLFGGVFQAIASGVDYPWMLYQMALGREVQAPKEIDLQVLSETPVLGLLATIREAIEDGARWDLIETGWADAKDKVADGAWMEAARSLWRGVKTGLDAKQREETLTKLLSEREHSVSQLLAEDDPTAALGLVYPLAIFLRTGKLTSGMIVGSEAVDEGDGAP